MLAYGGSNATSFLDLSLGVSLRPKRIFALVKYRSPVYEVTPSTTLFSSIFHFNGPTLNGSLRDIHLIRDGKKINSIDFYSYVTEGIKVNDENLITDDVIFIPTRGKTIKVAGEINRPAIYEIKEDESFRHYTLLVVFYPTYGGRAQINRIVPFEERGINKNSIDRIILDVNLNDIFKNNGNVELLDGDSLTFFSISNQINNYVVARGAIRRPGDFQFYNGMKVKDLISS